MAKKKQQRGFFRTVAIGLGTVAAFAVLTVKLRRDARKKRGQETAQTPDQTPGGGQTEAPADGAGKP